MDLNGITLYIYSRLQWNYYLFICTTCLEQRHKLLHVIQIYLPQNHHTVSLITNKYFDSYYHNTQELQPWTKAPFYWELYGPLKRKQSLSLQCETRGGKERRKLKTYKCQGAQQSQYISSPTIKRAMFHFSFGWFPFS